MVEGSSGILSCAPPWARPTYEPSKRRVTWPNGATATTYTAEEPEQLRGPQHDAAWCDEIAKWKYPREAWDQLMFGLRIGDNPRGVITTTPKPIALIKELVARRDVVVTRGSTFENRANLAAGFFSDIVGKYEGTELGRQELYGEIIDDAKGALWRRAWIDDHRIAKAPQLQRIVVAIDPSVSQDAEGAATGIVAAGLGFDGRGYVLEDASLEQPSPDEWARCSIKLFDSLEADRIVGEVNQGGDLVRSNLQSVRRGVPFKEVRATRGKAVRAEPIAALYEQGRISHVGHFGSLEDELCQWEPNSGAKSPNRLDALVWALTELYPKITRGVDQQQVRPFVASASASVSGYDLDHTGGLG